MSFYTSVARYGNSMLYRGYDQAGNRVTKKETFSPMFFVPSKTDTGWLGLDGAHIGSVNFENMREAKGWLEQYTDVSGFKIYGTTNYIHQYLQSKFPRDIEFDRDKINVSTIDIET